MLRVLISHGKTNPNVARMTGKPYVYIIDDDPVIREAVSTLLILAGYSTKSFSSGDEFLRDANSLVPGCVISDVRMPNLDGITLLNKLRASNLNFPVVLITGHADVKMAVGAMKSGAIDFVEKPFDKATLLASVERAQEELAHATRHEELTKIAQARLELLSLREREVLDLLVAGLPNKLIAYQLGISPRTVEFHRSHVMAKMQATSLSELVRLALAAGIKIKDTL